MQLEKGLVLNLPSEQCIYFFFKNATYLENESDTDLLSIFFNNHPPKAEKNSTAQSRHNLRIRYDIR